MTKIETELSVVADETEKLTEWEVIFIESISDQYLRTGSLTQKQEEILHRIYEKVV
jgi:uncharacterized membrane-anchored protein